MRALRPLAPLAFLAVVAVPAFAGVHVVDVNGGGSFTDIQAAVTAAVDGDTILVKTGAYAGFLVNAKSVQVVGDTGHDVTITGAVKVRSLPPGGLVLISNLKGTGTINTANNSYGIYVYDNLGFVRVELCEFTGADGIDGATPVTNGWAGAHVELSPRASFSFCTLTGGRGRQQWEDDCGVSGSGLEAISSNVALHGTLMIGGKGYDATPSPFLRPDSGHGGDGGNAIGSTLYFSGCDLRGGGGGNGNQASSVLFSAGGVGGDGLQLDAASEAKILETGTFLGIGGWWYPPSGTIDGLARRGPGTFTDLPGFARRCVIPSVVREATAPTITFFGQPGDEVYLLARRAPAFFYWPGGLGQYLVASAQLHPLMIIGTVPGAAPVVSGLALGDLGPGVESAVVHLQALFREPGGQWRIGTSGSIVILDSAY